jgi:hypothetical protein
MTTKIAGYYPKLDVPITFLTATNADTATPTLTVPAGVYDFQVSIFAPTTPATDQNFTVTFPFDAEGSGNRVNLDWVTFGTGNTLRQNLQLEAAAPNAFRVHRYSIDGTTDLTGNVNVYFSVYDKTSLK